MGGKTAMNFALTYSKFVSHLIVVDISPKYYAPHHQNILAGLLLVLILKLLAQEKRQMSNYLIT